MFQNSYYRHMVFPVAKHTWTVEAGLLWHPSHLVRQKDRYSPTRPWVMNRSLQHPVASISRSTQKKEFLLNACAINAISLPFSTLAKHFCGAHTHSTKIRTNGKPWTFNCKIFRVVRLIFHFIIFYFTGDQRQMAKLNKCFYLFYHKQRHKIINWIFTTLKDFLSCVNRDNH